MNTDIRDILNTLNIITETNLGKGSLNDKIGQGSDTGWRIDKFIETIKAGLPFETNTGESVIIEPSEADELLQQFADEGKITTDTIKLETGDTIRLTTLVKSQYFLGKNNKRPDASEDESTEDEVSKETALLKPSQIGLTDYDIPASQLGKEIFNNEVLNSTEYGKIVIQMSVDIGEGRTPTIPADVPAKIRSSIHDYAGEYLGVQAMTIKGLSRFPKRKDFEEWLGGSVSDLIINFPSSANNNIADSFAAIKNTKTNHTVNISSKGKGGGAPPSISGLKIPDHIKETSEFEPSVKFIEICQSDAPIPTPKTISQCFYAMNVLARYVPEAIPEKFKPFIPWNDQTIDEAIESYKAFKNKDKHQIKMEEYSSLWADNSFQKQSADGSKLSYVVKKAVMEAVNEGRALPEFQQVILEILDMNFVQQYADLSTKKGEPSTMTFATQWPAKLDGKVSLESKSGATDPTKGGFSFKLANTPPKTVIDEPDDGDGEEVKMNDIPTDLAKDAKKITDRKSLNTDDVFAKPEPIDNPAGRKKR